MINAPDATTFDHVFVIKLKDSLRYSGLEASLVWLFRTCALCAFNMIYQHRVQCCDTASEELL